jgi:hypothetical protein
MCLCSWLHAADLRVWFRVHGHCIVLSLAYDVLLLLLLLLLLLQWTCPRSTVVEDSLRCVLRVCVWRSATTTCAR